SIELLQKVDTPEPRRQRYIEAMDTTIERATRLTAQLLAFARRQTLEAELFDVSEKIAAVTELLRPLLGNGVQIVTRTPPTSCLVEADVCQFETALINLAINARDAMRGRGRIHIDVERTDAIPKINGRAAVP